MYSNLYVKASFLGWVQALKLGLTEQQIIGAIVSFAKKRDVF